MELPIYSVAEEFLSAVRSHQVTIVKGETGSGKTTGIPIILHQAGYASKGLIGVTEPRRIAATSVAEYVASLLNTSIGDVVGYQVRFDNNTGCGTAIKFMTDGILLREIQLDPMLEKYSVIFVDEAHERSQNIDFTLGLLKEILTHRADLKVIVASATIDSEKFSKYFWNAPIVSVQGRNYNVDVVYSEISGRGMVNEVVQKITDIHSSGKPGDVLVFVPGKEDIDQVMHGIDNQNMSGIIALPVYGGISMEEQRKVFYYYPGKRKVVVATNVAETSITIEGIVYVVDTGLIKQMTFHPETGIQSLDVVKHSQAGCKQRSGRAGRTQPGICYRLFQEEDFHSRRLFTEPEIRRISLAGVVLAMEDIGIDNVEGFDFIDPPEQEAFHEAYQTLIVLGAIASNKKGLTAVGKKMAQMPLEPRLSRMILEAEKQGCVTEVVTFAAFLSLPPVFFRPKGKEYDADFAHAEFKNRHSDALTCLNVWNGYVASGYNFSWCRDKFLNARSLSEITNVRRQILSILEQDGMIISTSSDDELIMKSIVSGLIHNLFQSSSPRYAYKAVFRGSDEFTYIFPGSSLYGAGGREFFVATQVVETTKNYARNCTTVKLEWLQEFLPHLFTFAESTIVSYEVGSDKVEVSSKILFRGQVVGTDSHEVSVDEAREIQAKRIIEAEELGWRELTFQRRGCGDHDILISPEGYTTWSSYSYREDVPYYCEVESFLGKWRASPKFQVYNFGQKKVVSSLVTGSPTQAQTSEVSQSVVPSEMKLTFGGNDVLVKTKGK